MKTSITQHPEFQAWLESQNGNPERDNEITSYNRLQELKKSKENFFNAAVILLIAIYITMFALIVF